MAELIRTAKSGSDWTIHELQAYNIDIVYEDVATFFGTPNLPPPTINPGFLTTQNYDDAPDDDTYRLLRTLDLAMSLSPVQESAVDDFAVLLLRALGYEPRGRTLRTRADLSLVMCGEYKHAKTDVCLIDGDDIVLLVKEDKRHLADGDPEPQLIVEAIAAFDSNNRRRVQTLGLPPLSSKVIAGIIMRDTSPIFYKIPVSTELVNAVIGGLYPARRTTVCAHLPSVPRPNRRWSDGMKPLDSRQVILSCYEGFKRFVK